ncbi:hypothetical protein FACS1894153_1800 [Bacteroidia bacterium]|nr:hypothetical protein FACS1894153_1800 [Bacteroidia bacterium]
MDNSPILDSICVDASALGNPGVTEYRAVDTRTGKVIFNHKLEQATNNIGEFLAVVHALALYQKHNINLPIIYTDSVTAMAWVRNKKHKSTLQPNEKTQPAIDLLNRGIDWLRTHTYTTKILKWDTSNWGEIPADYGRK